MREFKNILVVVDTRFDNHEVLDQAVEIAANNEATLKVVDVVPEFSWTVKLTMKDHEHVRDLMAQEKQENLEAILQPIREKGVTAEAKVLRGQTSVELIREVMRADHDLLLRVNKGKQSSRVGFFGNTGMALLRKCPCAVWLVTPEGSKFQHVLGCVDTSTGEALDDDLNDRVYDLADCISHYQEGSFSILQAWSMLSEQFLKRRMDHDEFDSMVERHRENIRNLLDQFLKKHGSSVEAENVHLIKGEIARSISRFSQENNVDLVVMGTVARSGISGMLMGNTAERILSQMECSVLALKPSNFVSPIVQDD